MSKKTLTKPRAKTKRGPRTPRRPRKPLIGKKGLLLLGLLIPGIPPF